MDRRGDDDPDYKGIERRVNEDRRKYPRFLAKDDTFVKLQSEFKVDVGQLIDISKDGLALLYTLREERSPNYSELGIFLLGVFLSVDDFAVDQISFQAVSDIELANELPLNTISYRRYAVQFEELTPEQTAKLNDFLLNHTIG